MNGDDLALYHENGIEHVEEVVNDEYDIIYDDIDSGMIKEETVADIAAEEEIVDYEEEEELDENLTNPTDCEPDFQVKKEKRPTESEYSMLDILAQSVTDLPPLEVNGQLPSLDNVQNEPNEVVSASRDPGLSRTIKDARAYDPNDPTIVPQDQWYEITGLKLKPFGAWESEAFSKPFKMGWRREVVLRATVTNSGKKIGDVYYFSPDKIDKLRSYVEMGVYLRKHPDCGLEPENFTFARQPIYHPPEEIVRHAMQRGVNHESGDSKRRESKNLSRKSLRPGDALKEDGRLVPQSSTLVEGKRKRVAPSRFEDEDYSEQSPFKKKSKNEKPVTPVQSIAPNSQPAIKLTLSKVSQNKDNTKSSLLHIVHHSHHKEKKSLSNSNDSTNTNNDHYTVLETHPINPTSEQITHENLDVKKQQQQVDLSVNVEDTKLVEEKSNSINENQIDSISDTNKEMNGNPIVEKQPIITPNEECKESVDDGLDDEPPLVIQETPVVEKKSTEKRIRKKKLKPIEDPSSLRDPMTNNNVSNSFPTTPAPCGISCPGKDEMLPNLLCQRCLCLFHLECVPAGVFDDSNRFTCPNCLPTPAKRERQPKRVQQNGNSSILENEILPAPEEMQQSQPKSFPSKLNVFNERSNKPLNRTIASLPRATLTQGHFQIDMAALASHSQRRRQAAAALSSNNNEENHLDRHSSSSSSVNVKLPAGTHLYRLPGSNKNNRSAIRGTGLNHNSNMKRMKRKSRHLYTERSHFQLSSPPSISLLSSPTGYQPAPIAPIAPITVTPNQVASYLQSRFSQSLNHIGSLKPNMRSFITGYQLLNEIFKYFNVRDLTRVRFVCRDFNRLAMQARNWQQIRMRGVTISDWNYFGRNIIKSYGTTEIDFDGLRIKDGGLNSFWQNYSSIFDYLFEVRVLRFGTIPSIVILEMIEKSITEDNETNPFKQLESLTINNLFDDWSQERHCQLSFLEHFSSFKKLKKLKLSCSNGFIIERDCIGKIEFGLRSLIDLRMLSLTNLKGLNSNDFSFLSQLKDLEVLEIGSCENWSVLDPTNENENCGDSIDTHNSLNIEDTIMNNIRRSKDDSDTLFGAFKALRNLVNLRKLTLIDVIIEENSTQLSTALRGMSLLESLTLQRLTISFEAFDTLSSLGQVIRNSLKNLRQLTVSSDDPLTNKCVLEFLKQLNGLQNVTWKVGAIVEDDGTCLIPFARELFESEMEERIDLTTSNEDSCETMDVGLLRELVKSRLPMSRIQILPQ